MMKNEEDRVAAVDELMHVDSPDGFDETLNQMFGAIFCSNFVDDMDVRERTLMLVRVRALKRFLKSV